MRLIQKKASRRAVRLSSAAVALAAALGASGCLSGGPGGLTYYQNNVNTGCKVTASGVTVCPGGRSTASARQ